MKSRNFAILFFCGLLFSCGSPLADSYRVILPAAPPQRMEILGEPHWRLEWYDGEGRRQSAELYGRGGTGISLLYQWPNAVLAWPYWPEKDISPGLFFPAGALYPFDISGENIVLSWQGGVDANFYRELALAQSLPGSAAAREPRYFDWPRFRTLLREEAPIELLEDPWLADWKDIAEKTALSGFRKSLIKAEDRSSMEISIPHGGPWIGASPFRAPCHWEAGQEILALGPRPEPYACSGGILSVSLGARLWKPFR